MTGSLDPYWERGVMPKSKKFYTPKRWQDLFLTNRALKNDEKIFKERAAVKIIKKRRLRKIPNGEANVKSELDLLR